MPSLGGGEVVALAIIALLVLGPEKLPHYAAEAGRWLRQLRTLATRTRAEVSQQLGPEFADISLQDLNPRTFVRRHVFDDDPDPLGVASLADRQARPQARHVPGQIPPYDPDAT